MLHSSQRFYFAVTAVTHDSTGSMSTLLQRQQANLVCIGKPCFFAADGAHANALIDIVRTIFNDAVF
ncbi:hypothetical protein SDC9_207366 [bioreactor metagenome]|uniref:Uncharacterized protein n=1 Tax=bioreactor metagenome TaxID=1076179 RepID=A0A645J7F3_9ZZZZ